MLVAEDDARFFAGFERRLRRIVGRSLPIDFMLLGHCATNSQYRVFDSLPERNASMSLLSKVVGWNCRGPVLAGFFEGYINGGGLYLISRDACRRACCYIDSVGGISWNNDDYEGWAVPAGLTLETVRPNLARWEGPTTIGGPGHGGADELGCARPRLSVTERIALRTRLRRFRRALRATAADLRRRQPPGTL